MKKLTLPQYINEAISRLNAAGHEAYAVGGCVRDMLRGVVPNDYDMTTSALPEETIAAFPDYTVIKTGIKHGTVTVMIPDSDTGERHPVEITTYRIDGSYADNRHPGEVTFTSSLEEDLKRRDFTVNAMAYNENNGLTDIFGGVHDIEARMINCVGDPQTRFLEDGLRILRALRFASAFDYDIGKPTSEAVTELRHLLGNISAERIYVEVNKLLPGAGARRILDSYRSVFEVIFPELSQYTSEQYEAAVCAVGKAPRDRITRYACLFAFLDENSAVSAMHRLKADNASLAAVKSLCREYSTENLPSGGNFPHIKRTCARLGYENAKRLYDMREAYGDGSAEEIKRIIQNFENKDECISLKQLKLNGSDLMSMGITGQGIGSILKALLDSVIDEKITNDKAALTEAAKKINAAMQKS